MFGWRKHDVVAAHGAYILSVGSREDMDIGAVVTAGQIGVPK